jgi:hypothetical protein
MEGTTNMSRRKNLNDVIHGDRAKVREAHVSDAPTSWEDWMARKAERTGKKGDDYVEVPKLKGGKKSGLSDTSYGSRTSEVFYTPYERCYHSHPALKLPGTDKVIYGGSCSSPTVANADVYIALDGGFRPTSKSHPWRNEAIEVCFPITDMSVPSDPAEFKQLVTWTKGQLDAGKKVHCGCIGGHGRTGMLLAAIVAEYGEKDAVNFVRQHYCKKAVETNAQVAFLSTHFGVKKVGGTKSYLDHPSGGSSSKSLSAPTGKTISVTAEKKFFQPIGSGSIWGGE